MATTIYQSQHFLRVFNGSDTVTEVTRLFNGTLDKVPDAVAFVCFCAEDFRVFFTDDEIPREGFVNSANNDGLGSEVGNWTM